MGAIIPSKKIEEARIKDEIFISIMGPLANILTGMVVIFTISLATWYGFQTSHEEVIVFIAKTAAISLFLGLFNMLPIFPFDGGRIAKGIIYSIKKDCAMMFCGFSIIPLAIYILYSNSWGLTPMIIAALIYVVSGRKTGALPVREKMSNSLVVWYASVYILLCVTPILILLKCLHINILEIFIK